MILINLIPYREARRLLNLKTILILWGITAVVGIGIAFGVDSHLLQKMDERNAELKAHETTIEILDKKLGEIKTLKSRAKLIKKRMKLINDLSKERNLSIRILDEITTTIPEKIWVTRMETKKGTFSVTGLAMSNAMVADFMDRLARSPFFSNIHLGRVSQVSQKGDKLKQFILSLQFHLPKNKNDGKNKAKKKKPGAPNNKPGRR